MKIKFGGAVVPTSSSSATATTVLILLLCAITPTIPRVSCGGSNSSSKLDDSLVDDFSAIMTELLKSTANVTEKSIIPQQNATALHSGSSNSANNNSSGGGGSSGGKTQRTCACDDSEESMICASNGVTYKNVCRFECAKARVNRLRQVKEGRCSQAAGAQSYWQSKKSG